MEREDKPKKVVKEKRSLKKTKASKASGEAISVATETKSADSPPAMANEKKIEVPGIEEIQLRAYFIGERRATLGLSGDSTSDWVQAERELQEEAELK
jgi:hypothetical protein